MDFNMATEAQARVQQAVERMLEDLEKTKLRSVLRDAHLCGAQCCENTFASKEQLEGCMQRCFQPASQIQQHLGQELSNFQDRLSRCAKQCQDEAQDKMTGNTTQEHMNSLQAQLDSCVVKCCDSHVDLIPLMMERINQLLKQVKGAPNT